MAQLTLELYQKGVANFDTFVGVKNAETVSALKEWSQEKNKGPILIWAKRSLGKSHALQAAVSEAAVKGFTTMYVPMRHVCTSGPSMLENLDSIEKLVIDDIDIVSGVEEWEMGFFKLYNDIRDKGGTLLWSTSRAPGKTLFNLGDLVSRVRASTVFTLFELEDKEKITLLQVLARKRGLSLSSEVALFIMRTQSRDMQDLVSLLDLLDMASLSYGRSLTIPFVKKILAQKRH